MRRNNYSRIVLFLLSAIFFGYCSNPSSPDDKPFWLDAFIEAQTANHSAPVEIWQYEWKGETVYYSIAQCCDNFNLLLDAKGKVICLPDGGYSGKGDGKCPNFISERKNGKLIWKKKT